MHKNSCWFRFRFLKNLVLLALFGPFAASGSLNEPLIGDPGLPWLPGETATQHQARVDRARDDEKARRAWLRDGMEMVRTADEIGQQTRGCLGQHLVMWYSLVAGSGAGALLSEAFGGLDAGADVIGPCIAGGVVVGGACGYFLKRWITNERCAQHNFLRVGGGVLSLVPWAITGMIESK